MSFWHLALTVLLGTLMAAAQHTDGSSNLTYLLAHASSLRVEYRADLQLRVLESQHQSVWRQYRDMVKALYEDLSNATTPYPQDYATREELDTLERAEAAGLMSSHLDGLSLRMRLLRDTAHEMPAWAANRLKDVRLVIPPTPCTSATVPIPNAYYEAVGDLIFPHNRSATPRDLSWFEETIWLARSPMQLASLADLIASIEVAPKDLGSLTTAYERALRNAKATDRELGYLMNMNARTLPNALLKMLQRLDHEHIPTQPLLHAYLVFLNNSMDATRCQDSRTDWASIARDSDDIATEMRGGNPEKLNLQNVNHQQLSTDSAIVTAMPGGEEATALEGKIYLLRTGKESSLHSLFGLEDRTSEMNSYADRLIQLATRISEEPSSCQICSHLRAEKILLDTFDLMPDGAKREDVLERVTGLLSSDATQETMPSVWNVYFNILLNMARPIADKQSDQLKKLRQEDVYTTYVPGTMQAEIRQALVNSHNPVMVAYVTVDEALGTPFSIPYLH